MSGVAFRHMGLAGLALLRSTGRWGYGKLCVARKTGVVWRATCTSTWIA